MINFTTNKECKQCNTKRSLKRYYLNKDNLSKRIKNFYERNRDVLLAKSKLNQQNRKFEGKTYKQQIEELNGRLEGLTYAI